MKLTLVIIFVASILRFSSNPVTSVLNCGPSVNLSTRVIWPSVEDKTCSLSTPGCVDANGILQIRCCENTKFDDVSCRADFSISDPRCAEGMRSTIINKSLNKCYLEVSGPNPFECTSKTGKMINMDTKLLSEIVGINASIWLPIERFGNAFRYTTRNHLYMDIYQSSDIYSPNCMILFQDSLKSVSCDESNLGVCLDYPFVIHKIPIVELDQLLSSLKYFCEKVPADEFCSLYRLGYQLNVAYFSSRNYLTTHYLILQKKNLRVVLQIRDEQPSSEDSIIPLFVALSEDDWNIFSNKSDFFIVHDPTDKILTEKPEIKVSMDDNTALLTVVAPYNIKWTQKDTCAIYCFFNASSTQIVQKYDVEIKTPEYFEFNNKAGTFWCDAFDYDLNIFRSNIVEIQGQDENGFISQIFITLLDKFDCSFEFQPVLQTILYNAVGNDSDFTYTIQTEICQIEIKTINLIIKWSLTKPAQNPKEIDEKLSKLNTILENMRKMENDAIQDIFVEILGHTSYCLRDITNFSQQPFIWPTTLAKGITTSQPSCYQFKNDKLGVVKRKCEDNSNQAIWLDVDQCIPVSNITSILQQLSFFDEENYYNMLDDLNILLENSFEMFEPLDVSLLSKILFLLSNSQNISDNNLIHLPDIISNIHLVRKKVLKRSQEEYNATDSILDTLTNIYAIHKTKTQFMSAYYSNIPINLPDLENMSNAASFALQLFPDITSSLVFYNEFFYYSNDYVMLSIFFVDYLFNGDSFMDHTEAIIFQALIPDKKSVTPFTVLVVNSTGDSGQFCTCWEYASRLNNLGTSNWRYVTSIRSDSRSLCVFKTFNYCAVIESEIEYEYVSRLSTTCQIQSSASPPPNFISVALSEILDRLISTEPYISVEIEALNEFDPISNTEFIVNWHLEQSSQDLQEIDENFGRMSKIIQKLPSLSNDVITKIQVTYIRDKKFCITHMTDSGTFMWPITILDGSTEAVPKCYISRQGMIKSHVRKCLGDSKVGAFWEKSESCSLKPNVTESLDYLINNFNYSEANDVIDDLDNMMKISPQYFDSNDVCKLANIFALLSNSTDKTVLNLTSLSSVVSGVQTLKETVLRDSQISYNATDRILYHLDNIFLNTNISESYILDNSQFYVAGFSNCRKCKGAVLEFYESFYKVTILEEDLDYDNLAQYTNFEAAILFSDDLLEDIRKLENCSIIISIFFKSVLFNEVTSIREVTKIFGILIPHYDLYVFPGAIELIYKNNKKADDCAYWEYGMKNGKPITGTWKNESRSYVEQTFLTCEFNHTTHFAMLIAEVEDDSDILDLITNVGCSLSLLGLSGILITGVIFERWRRNIGNIILLNFVSTMFIQIGLYYSSGFVHIPFPNTEVCVLTGALLHYSVVSEFCWMLVIALLQFKRFVQVLTGRPKYLLLKSLFVGWILPLIPVVSILAIDENNYTSGVTGLCYPSNLGLYLGVWLPIILIILINFIIFSYIMYSIFHRKTECVDTVTNEIIFQWRLVFLLFFMLGLTWSFAFIGQFILQDLFLYLFCASATLQGFVMFLFFIIFDKRTRYMYTSLFKKVLKKYNL